MTKQASSEFASAAAWAKRCYFAGRALMDATLRQYGLGSTQWYVLWQLANKGPTAQRDLVRLLDLERATLSGVISTLVRKGLVNQAAGDRDQRQRTLQLTQAGRELWARLPDLRFIHSAAFEGIDPEDLAITIRVLQAATSRLNDALGKGNDR
jgi:MarR family transcriptional regulator, lower aerobic nicotinate degradation pathway regulator